MDVFKAILKRRSIRAFKKKEIPKKDLEMILEGARLAPSAKNLQNWKFVVVKEKEKKKKLAEASFGQNFIAQASVVIAGVSLDPDYIMSNGIPAYAVDLAIALEHMVLTAVEVGLGSCWIGAFSQEKVKKILNIPGNYKVVALLPIGYPDESPPPRERKPLNEIVCFEEFKE